jgi:hypothetical protein
LPLFEFPNAYEAYPHLLRDVIEFGTDHASNGGDVREVVNAMITFTSAPTHVPPREGLDTLYGLIEGAQLLSGSSFDGLTSELFPEPEDDTGYHRTPWSWFSGELEALFKRLQEDRVTRRGVMTFWDLELQKKLAPPCVIAISFRIRDDQLNMSVHMRSNDLWNYAPHDFAQFGLIQRTFAAALGVGVGLYTHVADSLHIYHRDLDAVELELAKFSHPAGQSLRSPAVILPLAASGWDFDDIQNEAWSSCLAGAKVHTAAGEDIKNRISARLTAIEEAEDAL